MGIILSLSIVGPLMKATTFINEAKSMEYAVEAANKLLNIIKENIKSGADFPLRVLGPVRCSYGKISGKYRYRLILKCKNTADFRDFIKLILYEINKYKEFSKVNIYADINGDIGV